MDGLEEYEVHSAFFSEALMGKIADKKLNATAIKKEIERIKDKNFINQASEAYATLHYNAPGAIGKAGDSKVVTKKNSTDGSLIVSGYYNAATNGSLWKYTIYGNTEHESNPTVIYYEIDPESFQPKSYNYDNLPSPNSDLSFNEGKVIMKKTAFVLVSILTLGATLEAQAGLFFTGNTVAGVGFSAESLTGGSGEGIIEQNLDSNGKIIFNTTKSTSGIISGGKGLTGLGGQDAFLKSLNLVNVVKGGKTAVDSGEKAIKSSKENNESK